MTANSVWSLKVRETIWFILDSLYCLSLHIYVGLIKMASFSWPVFPSDDCDFF